MIGEAIFGALLWLVLGGVAVAAVWIITVLGSGALAVAAMEHRVSPVVPGATLVTGIILTILTFILVAYNVIAGIVDIVTIATGG